MKIKASFFLLLSVLICLTACNGSKTESNEQDNTPMNPYAPVQGYTVEQQDSAEVNTMITQFMEALKANQVDRAVELLCFYDGFNRAQELPADIEEKFRGTLNQFAGKNYSVEQVVFHRESDNLVKVNVELFPKEEGDPRPNTIHFLLRPVRSEGHWFLTLADKNIEEYTNHISEIPK